MSNKYDAIVKRFEGYYPDDYQRLKFQGRLDEYKPPALPLSEAHLKKIEVKLGYSLPDDYREFLRDYAGFAFKGVKFPLRFSEDEGALSGFLDSHEGLTIGDDYRSMIDNHLPHSYGDSDDSELMPGLHLVRHLASPIKETFWPEELLMIGYGGGLNSTCLALFGLRPGAIFYFVGFEIYLVADSFDEFMHLLEFD